jgi:soluble lytic murein transglycosylase-like protein
MRRFLTAASAALLTLALAGCETTGTSGETTGSISKSKTSETTLEYGYSGRPHGKLISKYAKANGVPESLAHAVVSVESNYRANARGAAGEIGLMQIKPATARMMGYRGSAKGLYDPETNIKYGMLYLAKAHQLGGGSTCGTILKYNAGHGAKRMNPVSKRYCGKIAAIMK